MTDPPVAGRAEAGFEILSITPEPTEPERAAIIRAIESLQARLRPQSDAPACPAPSPQWRYAGRRWQRRSSYGGWA
ncbi:MAG: hypothetical protein OXD37_08210 [Acidimicrobiaceae bacterium]|nr:hypothetical protein [Acidimicrobiaceae bacterium]